MNAVCFQRANQRAFGTYPLKGAACRDTVLVALEAGYRAIDTAQMYGNEADVGAALADSGLARDALFVVTKVHPDNYADAAFLPSVRRSLDALQVEQVDLLLLHWPPKGGDVAPPLRLLSRARAEGLARHVGVSNFTAAMLRAACATIADPLATNQVEFHPLLNQDRLLAAAAETGVPLSSYCSVARGAVFRYPLFDALADAYGKTPAQIVLRWILQKGVSINTMSSRAENIRANFDVMDFTLSSVDMTRIEALTATGHRIVTAAASPWAPDWD